MQELDVFNCPLDGIHLIEASAGTGKTWNICGLYLRLLLEQGRSVEEILVVTFTKAATAELRERIRSRLAELGRALEQTWSGKGDPFIARLIGEVINSGRVERLDAQKRLRLALESFDAAAIFTIHGFCQRALAETPFAASAPFLFEFMADDTSLRHEAATDFWRQHITHSPLDDGFAAHLMDSGLGPDWLAAQLGRRLKKPLSQLRWPQFPATANYSPSDLNLFFAEAKTLWSHDAEAITETILAALGQLHGGTYRPESVQAGAAGWSQYFLNNEALAVVDDKQRLFGRETLAKKTKKNGTTPSHPFFVLAETVLALRQDAQNYFALQRLKLLRDWLEQGPEALLRQKQGRRLVSYDDLLAKLHKALCGGDLPWLAAELRKRYPCALIDEFQDTDPLQFQIFDRIYASEKRGPLFLVGDPKQAIYSFRSADLNTYLAARESADSQFTLSANQRSTSGLIKALNLLFAANPQAFILEGLRYQTVQVGDKPRKPFADPSAGIAADLQVWMLPGDEDGEGLLLKNEARQLVTQATAAEISRLLRQAKDVDEDKRIRLGDAPLKPADIAVVVRSHVQGSAMKQALTALGIGCVELSQISIFKTCQAEEVERVLRAVGEPTVAASIKAALSTELLGQNGNDLETMNSREGQLTAWVQKFQDYRTLWQEHGFGYMWRTFLRQEKAVAKVLGLAEGERKLTNLLHLGELLQKAATAQPGIDGLLRWLSQNRRRQTPADDTAQLRLESDENLVQILTVHKAKGLEFPIVFCPFLFDGRSGGSSKTLEGLEYHQAEQGVIDFALDESQIAEAKAIAKVEDAAEQARLLYVALTRAVYRCYLVAGCYGVAYKGKPSLKESARSALNWMVAGAGIQFADWQKGDSPASTIATAWQALAVAGGDSIGLAPLPTQTGLALPPELSLAESFVARQANTPMPESWRLGSFSALNRLSDHEGAVPDHDAVVLAPAWWRGESPADLPTDDFLRFPRGPAAGECLHRVLELTDFSKQATWGGAILRGLRERPPAASELSEASLAAMLHTLLADLLTTPLRDGFHLSRLTNKQCLPELEFYFPTSRVTANDVNRTLARHGYDQPKLSFPALQGFVKGFIDLVFCDQGRYYLLDWKSNHLGYSCSNYGPESMAQALRQHGYHLQYLLYSLALHRFLRWRLADYDFKRHFGGCLYLFVRGIRPDWLNADGSPCGVFFHLPSVACIDELDRLFSPPLAVDISYIGKLGR